MRVISLLFTLLFVNTAVGQVVFKGPASVQPGTMQTIEISNADGDDLQVLALKNGVQTNENWNVFKTLDNRLVILLLPQPGDSSYVFIGGISKEKKTFITLHTVQIGSRPDNDTKPVVGNRFREAYNKSPDKVVLNKYIAAIEQIVSREYTDTTQMNTVFLESMGLLFNNSPTLKPLRDEVTKNIKGTTVPALKESFKAVLADLKGL